MFAPAVVTICAVVLATAVVIVGPKLKRSLEAAVSFGKVLLDSLAGAATWSQDMLHCNQEILYTLKEVLKRVQQMSQNAEQLEYLGNEIDRSLEDNKDELIKANQHLEALQRVELELQNVKEVLQGQTTSIWGRRL